MALKETDPKRAEIAFIDGIDYRSEPIMFRLRKLDGEKIKGKFLLLHKKTLDHYVDWYLKITVIQVETSFAEQQNKRIPQ